MEDLKNGMTVIAPCDGSSVKKGEEFIVSNVRETSSFHKYDFTIDNGKHYCLLNVCAQINRKNWIIKKNK